MDVQDARNLTNELQRIGQALTIIALNTTTDKPQITKHRQTVIPALDRLVEQLSNELS